MLPENIHKTSANAIDTVAPFLLKKVSVPEA